MSKLYNTMGNQLSKRENIDNICTLYTHTRGNLIYYIIDFSELVNGWNISQIDDNKNCILVENTLSFNIVAFKKHPEILKELSTYIFIKDKTNMYYLDYNMKKQIKKLVSETKKEPESQPFITLEKVLSCDKTKFNWKFGILEQKLQYQMTTNTLKKIFTDSDDEILK